jgi:hypothetical protein
MHNAYIHTKIPHTDGNIRRLRNHKSIFAVHKDVVYAFKYGDRGGAGQQSEDSVCVSLRSPLPRILLPLTSFQINRKGHARRTQILVPAKMYLLWKATVIHIVMTVRVIATSTKAGNVPSVSGENVFTFIPNTVYQSFHRN